MPLGSVAVKRSGLWFESRTDLRLTTMKVSRRRQKSVPNPMTKATLMACSQSTFSAVANDDKMEQSFEWSTGFSPLGVNHLRRSEKTSRVLKLGRWRLSVSTGVPGFEPRPF